MTKRRYLPLPSEAGAGRGFPHARLPCAASFPEWSLNKKRTRFERNESVLRLVRPEDQSLSIFILPMMGSSFSTPRAALMMPMMMQTMLKT